jgi:hypothetical protein
MRTFLAFCLSVFFISSPLSAQNEFAKVIHEFAEIHVESIKEKDLDKMLALVHPNLIAMGGGAKSYKSILESEMKMLEDQKIKILRAEFGEPGDIVKAGPELHCLVNQKLFIEFNGEAAHEETILLAASLDDGETWKFVDLKTQDTSSIKIFFPYYKDELMGALER